MYHVLILEDTLEVLSALLAELAKLEYRSGTSLRVTVYSTHQDVEELVNKRSPDEFDAILLDRNIKFGGTFHVLDIEKFGADKVISISSMPHRNEEIKSRGVTRTVDKNHTNLEKFAADAAREVQELLGL